MGNDTWRQQTPPEARRAFLRVMGPWVSASLDLRRRGLDRPSVDSSSIDHTNERTEPMLLRSMVERTQTRRAA